MQMISIVSHHCHKQYTYINSKVIVGDIFNATMQTDPIK